MKWIEGPRLKKVYERDIDLLLIGELLGSSKFRGWFGQRLGLDPGDTRDVIDIRHSVSDRSGESDIEIGVRREDGSGVLILVENKIDAAFQEDQLVRYHDRGQKRIRGEWDEYLTCVVAPKRYLESSTQIGEADATISYETVREWFAAKGTSRAEFVKSVFAQAIEKERRRSNSEVDEEVTQLHYEYWEETQRAYPQLGLEEPSGVAPTNHWIRFDPPTLPDDVALYHKMRQGKVDLEFKGMAAREEEFRKRYGGLLEPDMSIEAADAGLFVQIKVPPFTDEDIPDAREEGIQAGLDAANRLLEWYAEVSKGDARRLELAIDRLLTADEATIDQMELSYQQFARDMIDRR